MGHLSRTAFAAPLRDHLVSTQPRIGIFWDVVLQHPSSFPDREFILAGDGTDLLGLAEFRLEGASSLLSHVCVAGAARGQGIGTLLIRDHLQRHPEVVTMELDVFDDNSGAVRLYRRLGFEPRSATTWLQHHLEPAGQRATAGDLVLDEPHASSAWFETYGFCELTGRLGGRTFRAGRVGSDLLRLFAPEDMADRSLVAALASTFPEACSVIAVARAEEVPTDSALTPFMNATRMRAQHVRRTVL